MSRCLKKTVVIFLATAGAAIAVSLSTPVPNYGNEIDNDGEGRRPASE